jgi:hypothetical protein
MERFDDRLFSGLPRQRTDRWKVEQSLRIGFRLTHASAELRQTRPYQDDWKATLSRSVKRRV